MPIAHIRIMEGRSAEQVADLISEVTQAIHRSLGAPLETVRVLVDEVPKSHWGIGGKSAAALGR